MQRESGKKRDKEPVSEHEDSDVEEVPQRPKKKNNLESLTSTCSFTSKQIACFYLSPVKKEDITGDWKCVSPCDEIVKRSGTGWGNLMAHVTSPRKHPYYLEEMKTAEKEKNWDKNNG